MKKTALFLGFISVWLWSGLAMQAQEVHADDVLGLWWNDVKSSKIEIYKKDGKYYGKLAELTTPIDPDTGKPKVDKENPDENLRNRPLQGLVIMKDFEFDEDEWNDGEIYDPKSGNTYNCYMEFEDPANKDVLKVRGYIGYAFMGLGRTTYWTRVKE